MRQSAAATFFESSFGELSFFYVWIFPRRICLFLKYCDLKGLIVNDLVKMKLLIYFFCINDCVDYYNNNNTKKMKL